MSVTTLSLSSHWWSESRLCTGDGFPLDDDEDDAELLDELSETVSRGGGVVGLLLRLDVAEPSFILRSVRTDQLQSFLTIGRCCCNKSADEDDEARRRLVAAR